MNGVFIVGLTGQSGAGKTLVSEVFAKAGFEVINCDHTAREVLAPDTECLRELKEKFPQFFDGDNFDRKKAAALLFADRKLLDSYNAAIFPHINALIKQNIEDIRKRGGELILLDAPTLFEAGADKLCDMTIAVVAREDIRLERIIKRDGISKEQAKARFDSQLSEDFFRAHADIVIENNGGRDRLTESAAKAADTVKHKIKDNKNGGKK